MSVNMQEGRKIAVSMKNSVIALSTGIAVGIAVGVSTGLIVKGMTTAKSSVKKKVSSALCSVGNFFDSLSKVTG